MVPGVAETVAVDISASHISVIFAGVFAVFLSSINFPEGVPACCVASSESSSGSAKSLSVLGVGKSLRRDFADDRKSIVLLVLSFGERKVEVAAHLVANEPVK